MRDQRHVARRTTAALPGRRPAIGALAAAFVAAVWALGTWYSSAALSNDVTAKDQVPAEAVPATLSQPSWYFTREEPPLPPVVVPGMSQPSFMAPTGEPPAAPPMASAEPLRQPAHFGELPASPGDTTPPTYAASPSAVATSPTVATPAPAAPPATQTASGWSTLWRQFLGKTDTPAPRGNSTAVASTPSLQQPTALALAAAPAAITTVPAQGPALAEFVSPQRGGGLVEQALGIVPAQPAAPAAAASYEHTPAATAATDTQPGNSPLNGLWQQTVGNRPTPTTASSPPIATNNNAPAANATATLMMPTGPMTISMPTLPSLPMPPVTMPDGANSAAAAHAGNPMVSTSPAMPQPQGDPVLNKVADTVDSVANSSLKQDITAGLLRPLAMNPNAPIPNAQQPPTIASTPTATANASTVAASTMPAKTPTEANSLDVSLFTQPFEMTNSRATAAAKTAANTPSTPTQPTNVWDGPLLRQFAMSKDDDLRKPPVTPAPESSPAAPKSQESGWTFYVPTVPAPPAAVVDANGQVSYVDGSLVGFLQEATLEPTPQTADGEAQNGAGGKKADSLAEADKLGEKPQDNSLQFLRTQTVLLAPGDSQCDVGINYFVTENDFPVLLTNGVGIVGVTDAKFRIRQLTMPIEYRTGLSKRVQGFIGAPIGWSNTQLTFGQFEDFRNDGGFGDLDFGLTMQLKEAAVDNPYWVATVSGTAPSGGDPFTGVVGLAPSAPSLGQGFWSITGTLLFIQPYDPVVLFYGLGAEHFFEHEYIGADIQPGNQFNYTFGVGFSVNDRVTLSGRFRGTYQEEIEINGRRLIGSNSELMALRFSATISKPCERVVEPFVEFGLTDDATDVFFGVTWTFSPNANARKASERAHKDGEKK